MPRVIDCVFHEHDPTLVTVALVVCVLATTTSMRLLGRAASHRAEYRTAWVSAAALAFSSGVWTTHFLAMLAFDPGLPTAIDITHGVLSLALVAVPAQFAFGGLARQLASPQTRSQDGPPWHIRRRRGSWHSETVSGLLLAAGIAMMHFTGMLSMRLPALVRYDPTLVIASFGLGVAFSLAAARFAARIFVAALLLTCAVVAVHFVAMAAMSMEPMGSMSVVPLPITKSALAITTGGGCLLILALALLAFRIDLEVSARLATEAARFRVLADATFEGLIFERGGRIVDTNRALCRLLGVDAAALVGRPIATVISGGVSMHPSSMERPMEYELIQHDCGRRPVEVLWRTGPEPNGHVLAIRDMSREKSAQLQIQQLAHYDVLTGVGNRQLLEKTLQKTLAQPDRMDAGVALLCIDLDRFKAINDTMGPRVGDSVLIEAARRICEVVRNNDTVARVGSDEFIVIQPLDGQPSNAAALA